jgi:TatA/E family protein of Tat protein translocase
MFVGNIFGPDLGIIVLIILAVLIFGSQAPKIARNLGTAGKEFKKAQQEAEDDAEKDRAAKAAAAAVPTVAAAPPPAPVAATPAPTVAAGPSDNVTLSKADLEALLNERDARAKRDANGPAV